MNSMDILFQFLTKRKSLQIFTFSVLLTKIFSDVYNYVHILCQEARCRHHTLLHPFSFLLSECNSREEHEIDSQED